MAKFNLEIELDWLEDNASIDDALKEEIVRGITSGITVSATEQVEKMLEKKMVDVEKDVQKRIEAYLDDLFTNKIADLQIPHKDSGWSSKVEYIPLTEYIGMKYEGYLTKKTLNKYGNESDYENKAIYSITEYLLNKYFENEVTSKVAALIQKARKDAEDTICKTLETLLRDQLSADMVKQLNIPKMLEALQEKGRQLSENPTGSDD